MARRYTTRAEDAVFLLRRLEDATRNWKVGDACLSYNLREETTVADIRDGIVTLANGDVFHVSKLRRAVR